MSAVNPGLEVEGLGAIGLPFVAAQAKELKKQCQQAPFGKGELTLVDTKVRRVWQLEPNQFSLTNPDWSQFIENAVSTVQRELGLEDQKLESHLYNLLLYEKGSFFLPHRDSEKLERMVATLVIVLPSKYQGGELLVRHDGEQHAIDFSGDNYNPFHTHFAAFYADCEHEVRPLKSGYRLCLVYNLTLAKGKTKAIATPHTSNHVEAIARILRDWTAEEPADKLAITLEHQYTKDGLVWDALKGVDRVKARVLHEAAKLADSQAFLAQITLWESGSADADYTPYQPRSRGRGKYGREDEPRTEHYDIVEVMDSTLTAKHWSDANGSDPGFDEMGFDEDEIVPKDSLLNTDPEQEVSEYTGNAGASMEQWYRQAAIVLWPNTRHLNVLCDCGTDKAIGWLLKMMENEQKAGKKETANKELCRTFATKILKQCIEGNGTNSNVIALSEALLALDEPESIRILLRDVVSNQRSLHPAKEIQDACEKYGWLMFQNELIHIFTATEFNDATKTHEPRVNTLERNLSLFQDLCVVKSQAKAKGKERIQLCVALANAFVAFLESMDNQIARSLSPWRYRDVNRKAILTQMARSLITIHEFELFSRLIAHVTTNTVLYPLRVHIAAITELKPWFEENIKKSCEPVSRWVAFCRQQLEVIASDEPKPPSDYTREANIHCRCAHCDALLKFLIDPKEQIYRFQAVQQPRKHLEDIIRRAGCDLDCTTERIRSPQTLVCKKNTASFNVRLKKYHAECELLETIRAIEQSLPS